MMCPRCDSARIERWGAGIRCAICGMSYDPNQESAPESREANLALRRNPSSPQPLTPNTFYLALQHE